MAFVRPLIDYNGNLQEVAVNDYIQPAILGAGTPSSNTILDGSGNWVTVASLNYWTLTGSDVYRATGNVYIGNASSYGPYKLQVTGNAFFKGSFYIQDEDSVPMMAVTDSATHIYTPIVNDYLAGSATLLKTVGSVITRATATDITDLLGTGSFIQNQNTATQTANFVINGYGKALSFFAGTGGGYISMQAGNPTQAGYIEIWSSDKGRLGYFGYDNNNITYAAEGAANHVFLGNKTLIGSATVYGTQAFQVTGASYFSSNIAIAGNIDLIVGANRYIQIGSATNYYYKLQSVNDDFQILEAGTISRLTIKYPNGYIGMGTTNPLANVHVNYAGVANTFVLVGHNNGGTFFGHNASNKGVIAGYLNTDIIFGYNQSATFVETVRIVASTGNVGINTTTPNVNLEVSHHIRINSGSDQFGYQLTNDNGGTHFRLRYYANNTAYSNLITGVYTGIVIIGNDPSQNGTKTLQVNGGIRQNDVISGLVYANDQGEFQAATAANVATLLGTAANGSYIQNQSTSIQTGSFRIDGIGRLPTLLLDQSASNSYAELQFRKAGILQFDLFNYTDASSNLLLTRYGDAGEYLGTVYTVYRNTGNITFHENVGIGGIVPQYRLDVNGIGRFISTILVESSSTAGSSLLRLSQTGSNWWDIENVFPGHLKFTRGGVDHAMFTNLGKFLVGTTSVYNGSLVQINGSITQRGVLGKMIYADETGQLIEATASHIAATLGSGNYIQNQFSSAQSANAWITGTLKSGFLDSQFVTLSDITAIRFTNSGFQDIYSQNNGTIRIINTPYNASNVEFYQDGTTYFRAGIGVGVSSIATSRLRVDSAENIWTLQMTKAGSHFGGIHANANSMTFELAGAYHYAFNSNSAERMRIASTGNVLIGAVSEYGSYKLQVTGESLIYNGMLHIESASPTIRFRDTDNRGAYIHVNSSLFYILRMNDTGTGWETNNSGLWPLYINLENNNAFFGGGITQNYVKSSLVYADVNGFLNTASAQNVRDLLGTGSYIQNQLANVQPSSNFWITGYGRIGSSVVPNPFGANPTRFTVSGTHSDTTMSLYSINNVNDITLDLWASEPGLTYDGCGIGANVNSNPSFGRRNTSIAQSYIRFYAGQIYFAASTVQTANPSNSAMILSNTERLLIGYGADVNSYKVQINSGSATGAGLYVNGNINASGNIIADGYFSGTSSDRIYKSEFKEVSVYNVIDNIDVSSYKHKLYDNKRLIGSVAQDIQKYFPELITKDNNGRLRVDNYGYAALALQLGKETKSEVEKLKERVKELEIRLGI